MAVFKIATMVQCEHNKIERSTEKNKSRSGVCGCRVSWLVSWCRVRWCLVSTFVLDNGVKTTVIIRGVFDGAGGTVSFQKAVISFDVTVAVAVFGLAMYVVLFPEILSETMNELILIIIFIYFNEKKIFSRGVKIWFDVIDIFAVYGPRNVIVPSAACRYCLQYSHNVPQHTIALMSCISSWYESRRFQANYQFKN
ncbi:hypothetical protein AGLY_010476 [Aphis glycines]|uniref:Uncharacterized protein n=1 Tax=Aphis glycines TaxID=307491 RepID=A0A6G0TF01_APHGL|nr:hypothetical protein AGLY_010476 [Aphis glycines]